MNTGVITGIALRMWPLPEARSWARSQKFAWEAAVLGR